MSSRALFGILFVTPFFLSTGGVWGAEETITSAEYQARLEEHRLAAAALEGDPQIGDSLLRCLTDAVADLDDQPVECGRQAIRARAGWAVDLLDKVRVTSDADQLEEMRLLAEQRWEALLNEFHSASGFEPPENAEETLRAVLSRREFAHRSENRLYRAVMMAVRDFLHKVAAFASDWLKRFLQPLVGLLAKLVPEESSVGAGWVKPILWLVGLVLGGILLWFFYRLLGGLLVRRSAGDLSGEEEPVALPSPASLLDRAASFAEGGQWRGAIRFCYLGLIARLEREDLLRYDRSKTNWEYVRELERNLPAIEPFRRLTADFDLTWYGMRKVSRAEYTYFRTGCEEVMSPGGCDTPSTG